MTLPSQAEVVAKHVADALARGGRPVVGGADSVAAPYVRPVILTDVPENSAAVQDETFGPTVTVKSVVNMAEAVSFANAGRYGLGSAVFARDRRAAMVAARFGPDGALAHRLARGLDDRPLRSSAPPVELVAVVELDPPAERVDTAAFAGRTLAEGLMAQLDAQGLSCTLLTIEAETEHGECLTRRWRAEDSLGPEAMGERLRWQLEGWLAGTAAEAPSAGISRLSFRAAEVAPAGGHQMGFWGGVSAADRRAIRGLDRLRGILGPEAVFTGALTGGRGPDDRVVLVAWGDTRPGAGEAGPWPGRHPDPAPALVHRVPRRAEVRDRTERPVGVSARGRLSAAPALVSVEGGPGHLVVAWDPRAGRRRARFQLMGEDRTAYLCFVERDQWWVEATYD